MTWGLTAEHDHRRASERSAVRVERDAGPPEHRRGLGGHFWIERRGLCRIEAEAQPAFQHGAAHLAGADEEERPADIKAHASPMVSNSDSLERLLRRLAGPDHELEGLEIALAGLHCDLDQGFALARIGFGAAGQEQGMAVHDHAVGIPDVEMADPQLLVDQGDELQEVGFAARRDLGVEGAGKVQRLDVVHPGERDRVVAPAALHDDRDLVFARTVEDPFMRACDPLHEIDGMARALALHIDAGHAFSRRSPGRCAPADPRASAAPISEPTLRHSR